jgi:hypothetical protein
MADREPWPRFRREPGSSFLAPGIRERTDRDFAGPLRPGIAGNVGARGGAVASDSRATDVGMDWVRRPPVDRIGQKYPESDPVDGLIADRGGRRATRARDR